MHPYQLILSLFLLFVSVPAMADSLSSQCEQKWAAASNPSAELTQQCAKHWLGYGYGKEWSSDVLEMDPFDCSIPPAKFHLSDIRRMKSHLEEGCPRGTECCTVCDRAIEVMRKCEGKVLGLQYAVGEHVGNFEPALKSVLGGKALDPALLEIPDYLGGGPIPSAQLRILRNATFARYGRPFKSADLTDFFYGPDAAERFKNVRMPPSPNPKFSDSQLTETDKANIALIAAAEKKAK